MRVLDSVQHVTLPFPIVMLWLFLDHYRLPDHLTTLSSYGDGTRWAHEASPSSKLLFDSVGGRSGCVRASFRSV